MSVSTWHTTLTEELHDTTAAGPIVTRGSWKTEAVLWCTGRQWRGLRRRLRRSPCLWERTTIGTPRRIRVTVRMPILGYYVSWVSGEESADDVS